MRIASLRCAPYELPFRRPLVTARETLTERRGWLLHLQATSGRFTPLGTFTAIGEAAPLPAFGGEHPSAAGKVLEAWGRELPGQFVHLPNCRTASLPPALGLAGHEPDSPISTPAALHGLETSLIQLAARSRGCSPASWLHPNAQTRVAVNAALGDGEPRETLRQAREALTQGFNTLKIKAGVGTPERDEERLRLLRRELSPELRLRVDANGAWDEPTALALLGRWSDLNLDYVEQPVAAGAMETLMRLMARSPVPIAADESIRTAGDALRLLETGTANVLVLKPMLLGGPLITLRIAEAAHARGVPVVVTTSLEGLHGRHAALYTAAAVDALHLAAGLPQPPPAHGLATGTLLARDHEDVEGVPPEALTNGWMAVEG